MPSLDHLSFDRLSLATVVRRVLTLGDEDRLEVLKYGNVVYDTDSAISIENWAPDFLSILGAKDPNAFVRR